MEKFKSGFNYGYHWIELDNEVFTTPEIIRHFPEFFLKKSIFTHAFTPSDRDLLQGNSFILKLKNTSKIPRLRRGEYFLYEDNTIRTAQRSNQAFIESKASLFSDPAEDPAVEAFWQNILGAEPSLYFGFDQRVYIASKDPKPVEIIKGMNFSGYRLSEATYRDDIEVVPGMDLDVFNQPSEYSPVWYRGFVYLAVIALMVFITNLSGCFS